MSTKNETPEYPRTVFTLTANYSVRKLTLVRPYSATYDAGGYTKGGVFCRKRDIYASKAAAIKAGRSKLKRWKKNLERAMEDVRKGELALDKAAGIEITTKEAK